MNIICIKFNSKEEQVKGFYELSTKNKVLSFPDELYGDTIAGLQLLDELHISYCRATDDSDTF